MRSVGCGYACQLLPFCDQCVPGSLSAHQEPGDEASCVHACTAFTGQAWAGNHDSDNHQWSTAHFSYVHITVFHVHVIWVEQRSECYVIVYTMCVVTRVLWLTTYNSYGTGQRRFEMVT